MHKSIPLTIWSLFVVVLIAFFSCTKESAGNEAASADGAGGSTARFTIAGDFLYVVDHHQLFSIQISDPHAPLLKTKTDVGMNIETIFPYQGNLFIGSSSSMYIYSLADPARPQRMAKADYSISMACDPVYVKDSVAYAALRVQLTGPCASRGSLGGSVLQVYNIKRVDQPVLVTVRDLVSPQGLGVKDDALYVCERENGLRIFDVSDPLNPVEDNQLTGETFYDVIPYGNILICQVAGGFRLYDTQEPLHPVLLSSLQN